MSRRARAVRAASAARSFRGALAIAGALVVVCSVGAAACSGDEPEATPADGTGGSSGGEGGGDFATGQSAGSGLSPDAACATAVEQGTPVPTTLFIMFDKSGSMLDDQKWAGAKAALIAFFQDDDSAGLRVALRFFPDDAPVPGCNEQACSVEACAQPLVEAGELTSKPASDDPQQKALVDAVNSRKPGGETPMYPALAGATQWATAYAKPKEGTENTVVLLVTDGEPNGCNESITDIAALAATAHAEAGVITHVVGMQGANEAQLDAIAKAGGTNEAFLIGAGASVHTELLAAMKKITKTQLACVFAMPESSEPGTEVDPDFVNVTYSSAGAAPETLGQVASAAACGPGGGWYYDDPADPAILSLCPATCDAVQGDPDAKIEILLGCATQVK